MFTGIIEEVGTVKAFDRHSSGARLVISAGAVLADLPVGGSIAVNGVCLTAIDLTDTSPAEVRSNRAVTVRERSGTNPDATRRPLAGISFTAQHLTFAADLSPETLDRSNLGSLELGHRVNLERPLSPTGRLSGHFVQGHVDGTGDLVSLDAAGDGNWWLAVRVPGELLRYLVYKGSIAIDGISLTIAALDADIIRIAVIPHTYDVTSLRDRKPGSAVNIECDMIAKHVERLITTMSLQAGTLDAGSKLSVEELKEQGY